MIESPGAYVAQSPGCGPGCGADGHGHDGLGGDVPRPHHRPGHRRRPPRTRTAGRSTRSTSISIPLYVSGRLVGTLPGLRVITQSGGDAKARFEASLSVPLGIGAQAVVHYTTPTPATDTNLVDGILASTWNRGQILQALSLVRVQGNLAPKTISIRLDPRRGQLFGKVVDPFFNPLVGVPVVVQRWNGSGWRKVERHPHEAGRDLPCRRGRRRMRTIVVNGSTSLASAESAR